MDPLNTGSDPYSPLLRHTILYGRIPFEASPFGMAPVILFPDITKRWSVVCHGGLEEIIHEFNRPELMSSEYPELFNEMQAV